MQNLQNIVSSMHFTSHMVFHSSTFLGFCILLAQKQNTLVLLYPSPEKLIFIISSLMKKVFEEYGEVNWSATSATKTQI